MKKTQKILAVALMFSTALSGAVQADTLVEALIQAYQSNPELDAARAAQRANDEGVIRARTGYFPTIAGTASVTRSDVDGSLSGQFDSTNKFYQARIDQPIFRGFQTANATKQAGSFVKAGRAQLLGVEQRILLTTVTSYMDVVRDQAVLSLNINQVQVLERQLQASQARFRVGEITRTDVAQSQARLAGAVSQRIQAEADLATSRARYWQVIGDLPGTLESAPALPSMPATLEEATVIGLDESPIVNGAVHTEAAARYAVRQAMGTMLPTLDGFAFISRFDGTSAFASAVVSNITTTKAIGAQLRVPLYQAGAEYSDIRRAKQIESQRRLEIIAAERAVTANVRTSHTPLSDPPAWRDLEGGPHR